MFCFQKMVQVFYAIVEDFNALPKDIRDSVDIVARFDPAAIVQRRGPAACPQ